ncbi:MAG TPA: hypothetical protein VKB75_04425 [Jatrophihabitans sp.]|nr:hypothetical protein [Jatrophihabitans sp.]
MFARAFRITLVAVLTGGMMTALATSAGAVGTGTFTKITAPSGSSTAFKFNGANPATNHLTVSGVTSLDVTSVDIVCTYNSVSGPTSQTLQGAVAVTSGAFSTVVPINNLLTTCRLRAVPTGVSPSADYIGAYTGPVLYMSGDVFNKAGSTIYGYTALTELGDGLAAALDAAQCGPALVVTVAQPGEELRGLPSEACGFALPATNITGTGTPNASAIKVDNHNAYLPYSVHNYLNGSQSLALAQPALATTFTRSANGAATVTESAPLKRCSVDDTFPPTTTSCPSLVNTGVTFRRVSDLLPLQHRIRVRDTFTSADGQAHSVKLQYEAQVQPPDAGNVGYMFPGSAQFKKSSFGQVVTGLGTKANTLFIRSDLHSLEGDPGDGTLGFTWSRAPQRVVFDHSAAEFFAMPYTLTVAAHGRADLGFGYCEQTATTDAKKSAQTAVNEMINAPTISSPAAGATVHGKSTTVKGAVTLGANGLPTKVTVNGHIAHLTKVSATKATYAVTFSESLGKHTITVTAQDIAANTRSRSIKITNV